jgi:multisubunit Na+/H+ antiporter MnhB subunit
MTAQPTTTAKPKVHRHRVMGFFAGLLFGVGLVLMLFVYGIIAMTWVPLAIAAGVGALLGIVFASVVPGRTPKPKQ